MTVAETEKLFERVLRRRPLPGELRAVINQCHGLGVIADPAEAIGEIEAAFFEMWFETIIGWLYILDGSDHE